MTPRVAGLVLAGGQGRRLGGVDKALLPFRGHPLIERVLARLAPQVDLTAISANGDPTRFASFGCHVLPDADGGGAGPLAGVLAGLDWAKAKGATDLVTVAVDSPAFPHDLVQRLAAQAAGKHPVLASGAGRAHPTFALWPVGLAEQIAALYAKGERRLGMVADALGAVRVEFPVGERDPFFNLNTPDDMAQFADSWAGFDRFVMVDWSAASVPRNGKKDSIWIGLSEWGRDFDPLPMPTRHAAGNWLAEAAEVAIARDERLLIGFDFAFGYPAGLAARVVGEDHAFALWDWLDRELADDELNRNDRFEVAHRLNRLFGANAGPFWGRPAHFHLSALSPKRDRDMSASGIAEHRLVELALRAANGPGRSVKSVWQLAYAGAVGSQVLTGLPVIARLRRQFGEAVSVWPFEDRRAPVTIVEIYPAMIGDAVRASTLHPVTDARQVALMAKAFRVLDAQGRLDDLFGLPDGLSALERQVVTREEGWIIGTGHEQALAEAAQS